MEEYPIYYESLFSLNKIYLLSFICGKSDIMYPPANFIEKEHNGSGDWWPWQATCSMDAQQYMSLEKTP